jgi:MFS-type transporter involved in bile tolerance (Atg22 family)
VFFAIFSTINKTSSLIGPFVSSAIIDDTGNNNTGFSFLLAICVLSLVSSCFLNQEKARVQSEEFLLEEQRRIANGESLIF